MLSTRAILKCPLLAMAILATLAGFVSPAAADIEVSGASQGDADTIRSYFAGTSAAEVQAGLEALKASGRFSNVSATRRGDHVIIRVSQGNLINRVAFEGNSKIKTDQLQTDMRTKAHASFNPQSAEQDVARLTEIYKRSGRAAAKVSYRTVALPNGMVDVVFTVDEGEKTGVREIRFIGNNVFSTSRLVGLMETTEMNFLSFLKRATFMTLIASRLIWSSCDAFT